MKKIVSVILCLVLICSLSVTVFASSDKDCVFSLSDASVAPGNTVAVPLNITKNAGFWGFCIYIRFDSSVFTLKEIRNTQKVLVNGEMLCGPESFDDDYIVVTANGNSITENNKKTGNIATLYFEVSSSAKEGKYDFKLDDDGKANFCNVDGKTYTYSLTGSSVTVDKSVQPTTINENKAGEILATSPQYSTDKTNSDIQGTSRTVAVTDSNGQIVTNSKGEVVTEIITEALTETTTDSAEQVNSDTNDSSKTDSNNQSDNIIYYVIGAAIVIAALIVLLILRLKSKKNKSLDK